MKLHFIHNWSKWSEVGKKVVKGTTPSWNPIYESNLGPYVNNQPIRWEYVGMKNYSYTKKVQRKRCLVCNKQKERELC